MLKRKKGFTLIELLVVIAIIAILAAILFPVFTSAKNKARMSVCMSNLKQIGNAIQMYRDDYNQALPFYLVDPGHRWQYGGHQYLERYTKNKSVFICPADLTKGTQRDQSSKTIGWPGYVNFPYSDNAKTPSTSYFYWLSIYGQKGWNPLLTAITVPHPDGATNWVQYAVQCIRPSKLQVVDCEWHWAKYENGTLEMSKGHDSVTRPVLYLDGSVRMTQGAN